MKNDKRLKEKEAYKDGRKNFERVGIDKERA